MNRRIENVDANAKEVPDRFAFKSVSRRVVEGSRDYYQGPGDPMTWGILTGCIRSETLTGEQRGRVLIYSRRRKSYRFQHI
jgi:hypothetical protein